MTTQPPMATLVAHGAFVVVANAGGGTALVLLVLPTTFLDPAHLSSDRVLPLLSLGLVFLLAVSVSSLVGARVLPVREPGCCRQPVRVAITWFPAPNVARLRH